MPRATRRSYESAFDGCTETRPTRSFAAWTAVWTSVEFGRWNVVDRLGGVTCPVPIIQGLDDAYGTLAQVEAVRAHVGAECHLLILPQCGHAPHRDHPEEVRDAMLRFIAEVRERRA